MQQAINLFDHLEKRESIKVSSQHIALAAIVTICIVLLVSLVTLYNSSQDAHTLQLEQEKDESLQAQLTSLQASSSNDSKAIQRSKRLLKQRREILSSLSSHRQDDSEGFSDYLAGLGRQQLTGLWLNTIALRSGGENISLKGRMQNPTLLPRYLQDLGKEPSFSGLRFQLMRIEKSIHEKSIHEKSEKNNETNNQMQFEVSVAPLINNSDGEV